MLRSSFPRPAILRPTRLRKRLWQGGVALAVIVVTFAIGNLFLSADKRVSANMLGHDFLPFYTAGTFVNNGMHDLIYDLGAVKATEHELADKNGLEIGKSFGPFWNPPFYALIFGPLATLPYREALFCWTMLNVASLLAAMILLIRFLKPDSDWRTTSLVPLLILVSVPFIQAISHGQNTFTSLMLVALIATFWRKRNAVVAGLCCGLLLYKPQLAGLLVIMVMLDLGWRAGLAAAGAGACFFLISAYLMPGSLADYMVKLPLNLHYMQVENTYLWERHATLRAFWRLLFQGRGPGEITMPVAILTTGCSMLIGGALVIAAWRNHKRNVAAGITPDTPWTDTTAAVRRDRLIAATIAATPLVMPFYFDYDLLLLAVPATLLAAELNGRTTGATSRPSDKWLVRAWAAMFLWLTINPGLAGMTRVNGTVILLSTVATLLTTRALRRNVDLQVYEARYEIAMNANPRRAAA